MANDLVSKTPNIAEKFGKLKLNQFIRRIILPLELLSGVAFFALCAYHQGNDKFLFLLLFILSFNVLYSFLKQSFFPNHFLGKHHADNFYRLWWTLLSLVFLAWKTPIYLLLFLPLLLLFAEIDFSLLTQIISHYWQKFFTAASSFVNYSIYYFRKYVLRCSEEKNRGIYYQEWVNEKQKKDLGTIALFNSNANKYTETFIQGHLGKLPYWIEFYHGDPIQFHYKEGSVIYPFSQFNVFLGSYKEKQREEALISSLQSKGVELLLCEFWTTAVQLTQVSKKTGIPLVAIFYGYDALHKTVLENQKENYKALFEQAQLIIGVSKDICAQLEKLGCPKAKITYLPCYVDLNLFQPKTKIPEKNIFLSVGRFAETKSPHFTILAFHEVLKSIPDAELRMIGKDGGG